MKNVAPRFGPLKLPLKQFNLLSKHNGLTTSEVKLVYSSLNKASLIWDKLLKNTDLAHGFAFVHGDLTPQNILVSDSSLLLHDFENLGVGPYIWDFVRQLYASTRYDSSSDFFLEFVNGYETVKPGFDLVLAEQLLTVMDVCSTLWSLTGRLYDYDSFALPVQVRPDFLAGYSTKPTWVAGSGRLYKGLILWK